MPAEEMNILRKTIGVALSKSLSKHADGTLTVRGFFTSDQRDEVGDIITRAATEAALPKYRQWGNIRYMHQPKPVGRVTRIGIEDGLAWNEVEIRVIDPQAVFEVENELLQALSVGILINFSDIDMLADGGWIVNSYSLAEISLVDHPANYDARLSDISLVLSDETVRAQARELGIVPALRSLGITNNHGVTEMTIKKESHAVEGVQEQVEKDASLTAETTSNETKDMEVQEVAAAVVQEVKDVEPVVEPVVEQPVVLADVVEDTAAVEEKEPDLAAVQPQDNGNLDMAAFIDAAKSMASMAAALSKALDSQEKATAKALNEHANGDTAEKFASMQTRITELEDEIKSLQAPVNRDGGISPEKEVPTEAEIAAVSESFKTKSLRDAVSAYAHSKLS